MTKGFFFLRLYLLQMHWSYLDYILVWLFPLSQVAPLHVCEGLTLTFSGNWVDLYCSSLLANLHSESLHDMRFPWNTANMWASPGCSHWEESFLSQPISIVGCLFNNNEKNREKIMMENREKAVAKKNLYLALRFIIPLLYNWSY